MPKLNSFLKKGFLIFIFLLAGRFIQFIKEVFVAKEIGVSGDLDAFIIAHLVFIVFLDFLFIPFSYALIPVLVRLKQYSLKKANLLFTKVLLLSLFLGIICLFFIYYYADDILSFLAGNFDLKTQIFTKKILFSLTPFYIFSILSSLFGAYLNALKKDFLYTIYPAIPAFFTILYFLFIPLSPPIYQQVYGFNIGSFVGLCLLGGSCFYQGYKIAFNFKIDVYLKACLRQWFPLIFSAFLLSINTMVDKKMAADLGQGSVSHLEYGIKLFSIFSGFAINGITILIYPYYSEKVAKKDYVGILQFLKKTIQFLAIPLIFGTALVVFFSEDIIKILFEGGAFNATDTKIVSEIMNYYMISFPVLLFGIIGVRLINALQLNKLVLYFSLVNLVLNIGLNIVFTHYIGLKGLALSSSVVYLVNAILMWTAVIWFFRKKNIVL